MVWRAMVLPHSYRVTGLILSSGYRPRQCRSNFLPPPRNMTVDLLTRINRPRCVHETEMDFHGIPSMVYSRHKSSVPGIGSGSTPDLARIKRLLDVNRHSDD